MDPEIIEEGIELVAANPWIITVAVLALLAVFFMILKTSLKIAAKILINAVLGFVLLFVFNGLGSVIGVTIEINWISAVIAGVLGVPGIALMLILKWMGM